MASHRPLHDRPGRAENPFGGQRIGPVQSGQNGGQLVGIRPREFFPRRGRRTAAGRLRPYGLQNFEQGVDIAGAGRTASINITVQRFCMAGLNRGMDGIIGATAAARAMPGGSRRPAVARIAFLEPFVLIDPS